MAFKWNKKNNAHYDCFHAVGWIMIPEEPRILTGERSGLCSAIEVGDCGIGHVGLDDSGEKMEHGDGGRLVVTIANCGGTAPDGRHANEVLAITIMLINERLINEC